MKYTYLGLVGALLFFSCDSSEMKETKADDSQLKIMTLDPGHFHAGLIHKSMYPQVDSTIHVFAPDGEELKEYLTRIEGYNTRSEDPTSWDLEIYKGQDYLQKMIDQKPGNVMVVAGKNDRKIDYISAAIENGIHVYADKPLVIDRSGFQKLVKAFGTAEEQDLLLFDIMTERFEITTMLQRELSMIPEVFGTIEKGSLEDPAISKESVHHFFKYVSGKPLVRPEWFFDTQIEGSGLVDVTTHLVDLIQWELFPEQKLDTTDVAMLKAELLSTSLDAAQYEKVTGKKAPFDPNGQLDVPANGLMNYTLKGIHAKVSVLWNFEAPEGTADTHYSKMRGTKANLIIRQGAEENYRPALYVELLGENQGDLEQAITQTLQDKYPGIALEKKESGEYEVLIPDHYHNGHEAHFAQVTEQFLNYYEQKKMADWEVPFMITKYYTTTQAFQMAQANSQ
ncbi:putative oxidoreductase C-terminal domain-containing protein [Algoriphagus vanfongensis]|uniref:putative oxidoreductase C-terminal domain-containing protein n=1 Tax=Algoriphagus vanfongensis TaxID=426371 RepID=UPI0003F9A2FC|nr:putative oxidoreductase C-terminal domain-containing protein [Algoriphagus vanfongensis]